METKQSLNMCFNFEATNSLSQMPFDFRGPRGLAGTGKSGRGGGQHSTKGLFGMVSLQNSSNSSKNFSQTPQLQNYLELPILWSYSANGGGVLEHLFCNSNSTQSCSIRQFQSNSKLTPPGVLEWSHAAHTPSTTPVIRGYQKGEKKRELKSCACMWRCTYDR